ncbi:MAG: shikimate dehydrogenase [Acidobacteriota bacterium]
MPKDFTSSLVACLGDPVRENPTGIMQEAAFRALGLNWRYLTIEVPAAKLRDALIGIRALGMAGANLTMPHKVSVMKYLDEMSPDAAVIGAVNTIRRKGDRLIGENTDGKGFLRGLRVDAGIDPKGKRAVVLGAGGAARAIVTELALAGTAEIVVVNRSIDRGRHMAEELARKTKARIRFESWQGIYRVPSDADLLVNATSIGLYPDIDAMPAMDFNGASPRMLVTDAVPNPPETALLKYVKELGFPVLDGLSMLVHQGVIGFRMWTGQDAPEGVMKAALLGALNPAGIPVSSR